MTSSGAFLPGFSGIFLGVCAGCIAGRAAILTIKGNVQDRYFLNFILYFIVWRQKKSSAWNNFI